MSHFCNDKENAIVDGAVGAAVLTKTVSLTLHIHIGDPGEAGTASEATGYTPPTITMAAPVDGVGDNRKSQNSSVHTISISTGQTISWWSLWDDVSDVWCRGVFDTPIVVPALGDLDVAANDIEVELSGNWTPTVMDGVLNALRSNANMDLTAANKVTLCTGDPGEGVVATEFAGITRQTPTWNAAAAGVKTNNGAITWPTVASQTAAWFALVIDSSGQVLWREDITNATDTDFRIIDTGMSVTVD